MPNRRILVFGTFDLLHPGHVSFLRQAKRRGHELVVAVARDANVRRIKGRRPAQSERRRAAAVRRTGLAVRVLLASTDPDTRYAFIKRIAPDIICLGYDQTAYTDTLADDLVRHGVRCRIVRLKPFHPRRYKSSLFRSQH